MSYPAPEARIRNDGCDECIICSGVVAQGGSAPKVMRRGTSPVWGCLHIPTNSGSQNPFQELGKRWGTCAGKQCLTAAQRFVIFHQTMNEAWHLTRSLREHFPVMRFASPTDSHGWQMQQQLAVLAGSSRSCSPRADAASHVG